MQKRGSTFEFSYVGKQSQNSVDLIAYVVKLSDNALARLVGHDGVHGRHEPDEAERRLLPRS